MKHDRYLKVPVNVVFLCLMLFCMCQGLIDQGNQIFYLKCFIKISYKKYIMYMFCYRN